MYVSVYVYIMKYVYIVYTYQCTYVCVYALYIARNLEWEALSCQPEQMGETFISLSPEAISLAQQQGRNKGHPKSMKT